MMLIIIVAMILVINFVFIIHMVVVIIVVSFHACALLRRTECLDAEVCASGFTREMQQLLDQEVIHKSEMY